MREPRAGKSSTAVLQALIENAKVIGYYGQGTLSLSHANWNKLSLEDRTVFQALYPRIRIALI